MARLGDYVSIRTGKLDANASSDNGIYPFFTCSKEPLKIDTYSYDCECVLVAGNGDLNVKYYSGKFDAYQRTYIIESKNKDIVSVRYLFYFLDNYLDTLRKESIGGVIKYIKLGNLTEAKLPLPPLEEQHKIAVVLDKVSDLIAKRRQQLDKLDLLVKSKFVEMFGDLETNPKRWPLEKLKEHSDIIAGNPFNSNGYTEDGVNICGSLIIMPDRITWEDCKHWPSTDGLDDYLLQSEDIVLAMDRPWISSGFKIAKIKEKELPALLIQRTARIRGSDLNQDMILAMLSTKAFEKHCNITSTTVPHISMGDIRDFPVMIPPVELQNRFSLIVKQADKSKSTIQQSLEKLETLKKALMQEYFG